MEEVSSVNGWRKPLDRGEHQPDEFVHQGDCVNRADFVYVGTSTGVFVSLDNGGNWTADTSGLAHPDIRSIAFDTMGHVYVGAYSSSDNGGLWRSNAGLPIELTSFTAQETGGAGSTPMEHLSEVNNLRFMVERSAEPTSDFLPVLRSHTGTRYDIVPHSYTFTDNPPPAPTLLLPA